MSRFRTVFGFELSSYLKNKVIIGVTIFLVLASAIMLSFPRFTQGWGSGTETVASADRTDTSVSSSTNPILATTTAH